MDAARWVRPQEIADPAEVTSRSILRLLYHFPSLRAIAWYRLGSWTKDIRLPGVSGYIQRRLLHRFGLEMVPGASVGGGLYIAHPVGTTLVAEEIGVNVTVIGSVTLGRRNDLTWPRIGDRVFIGAGARILGGIRVGSDAVIGANAVVVHDVGDADTVVGIPARSVGDAPTIEAARRV